MVTDQQPIKVLLVEDNMGDARLLREALAEADPSRFQLTHVQRLSQALVHLDENAYNVVLLDLGLPDSHGIDTLALAQAHAPTVPIVVLTGLQDEELAIKAARGGPQDYLVKGHIESDTLKRSMRYAIERKRAEEQINASLREKEILLKEIHHRVKNNMQLVSSLLSLQSNHVQDPRTLEMLKDSHGRIQSMALIHDKLYQSKDFSKVDFPDYIRNFTASLLKAYASDPSVISLELELGDVLLGMAAAIPCGLILNELVPNSFKHAFPKGNHGTIRIELFAQPDCTTTLLVSDNGMGFPQNVDFRNIDSMGMQLVCGLTQQINGTVDLERNPGTTFKISFPSTE